VILSGVRDGAEEAFETAGLPTIHVGPLDRAAAEALLDARSPGLPPAVRHRMLEAA
jgi:hypothetical protein